MDRGWVLQDRMFDEEHMYDLVRRRAGELNMENSLVALEFASEKHKSMFRKGKDRVPYIYHPLLMACQALALGLKRDEIVATCLLHDVVEDCGVRAEELPVSGVIREAVRVLSHDKAQDFGEYIETIRQNCNASIVKIIDRCCNVSTMATGFSMKKMAEYIMETEEYILPLIDEVRHNYAEFYDVCFLLKYQILAVMETVKHVMSETA